MSLIVIDHLRKEYPKATPLADVPLGIKYVKADGSTPDDTQWHGQDNYYQQADMPRYRFMDTVNGDEPGYFPSMTYQYAVDNGFVWNGINSDETSGGNYYKEWDFYCYYEPEYHWINFKRNGNDHWHENAPDFHIDYKPNGVDVMNEEYLIPGKGYLVAAREHNTFLQAKGVLNGDTVAFPVTRLGYFSPGYNLLGNRLQSLHAPAHLLCKDTTREAAATHVLLLVQARRTPPDRSIPAHNRPTGHYKKVKKLKG